MEGSCKCARIKEEIYDRDVGLERKLNLHIMAYRVSGDGHNPGFAR